MCSIIRCRRLLRRATGAQREGRGGKEEGEGSSKGHGQESEGSGFKGVQSVFTPIYGLPLLQCVPSLIISLNSLKTPLLAH